MRVRRVVERHDLERLPQHLVERALAVRPDFDNRLGVLRRDPRHAVHLRVLPFLLVASRKFGSAFERDVSLESGRRRLGRYRHERYAHHVLARGYRLVREFQ